MDANTDPQAMDVDDTNQDALSAGTVEKAGTNSGTVNLDAIDARSDDSEASTTREHDMEMTQEAMSGHSQPGDTASSSGLSTAETMSDAQFGTTPASFNDGTADANADESASAISSVDLTELERLYLTLTTKIDEQAPVSTQLECAEALVFAGLSYYFPKDQGFSVEPADLSKLAGNGWNFWLVPAGYRPFPKQKGGGLSDPEQPFLPDAKGHLPTNVPDYKGYITEKQHHIPAQLIKGFRVVRKQNVEDKDGRVVSETIPHTYLAIMMDDLATFPKWVPDYLQKGEHLVSNPRHDILRYSLSEEAKISKGYGIVMLGPRIEAYNFNWQGVRQVPDTVRLDVYDSRWKIRKEADPEPFSQLDAKEWMVDLRDPSHTSLEQLDDLFTNLAERDVEYQDGSISPGVKEPSAQDG
ncbi:hypothetical protein CC80DRAFT_233353 [Byssothecium circinans]|uniref:Uncharacterized protein n=1 Tax=Byssothecium circinans TaxID=147558 RepID=A0A6A5UA90_9PLEO|nr:hypothetical protein CC80DRAFT_233353 [Byssothecium circinans]